MPFGVNTNISAVQSLNALHVTQASMTTSVQRLATGLRINSAKDDPAGLIAVLALSKDIVDIDAHLGADQRAGFDAAALEGKLTEKSRLLLQLKSLAVGSADDAILSDDEKRANQQDIDVILKSLARLAGTDLKPPRADAKDSPRRTFNLVDLFSGGALDVSSGRAADAVAVIDRAIRDTATARARLGAHLKYDLGSFDSVLANTKINEEAARSQIQDTDFAAETANFFRTQALAQVNTAALGFSQVQSSRALTLLG